MKLLDILQKTGHITEDEALRIRKQEQTDEAAKTEILAERGVSIEDILKAKSEVYGVPYRDLRDHKITTEALNMIPKNSVEQYQVLPLGLEDDTLEVGFVDPGDIEARDAVQFVASKHDRPFKMYVIAKKHFDELKDGGGSLSGEVGGAISALESELSEKEEEISEEVENVGDGTAANEVIEDAPVTKIVATILRYATEGGASDVHVEPVGSKIRVRFRVDGQLHTSLTLPMSVLSAVVARIKILSEMKLDEKRKPQDGRFSAHINDRKIDFRVSTFPTYYGEKIVLRILDPEEGIIGLDDIGLTKSNQQKIDDAIHSPYGMILISGPTGSGKTTTLYSMLQQLDTDSLNVLSLEDPVEYNLDGINQSQVQPEIGYTFANGLRTTLRQDPDVIMVGEIRDKETARLAVRAALTGHLVLSTIHTNSATGVIPRLVDMGIDPYLIAPTLILAIAQRLVRRLCESAGKPKPIEGSIERMIDDQFNDLPEKYRKQIDIPDTVYEPQATDECPTGLSGRTAVFELLEVNDEVERAVLDGADEAEITDAARANGMLTMKEDALLKAFDGTVPFEEVGKL
jgi:type IV pilus assembly protein PilB